MLFSYTLKCGVLNNPEVSNPQLYRCRNPKSHTQCHITGVWNWHAVATFLFWFLGNLKLLIPWCLIWCFMLLLFLWCRDGRLREGDQILAIDGQPLDSNISHQQAISILQKARGLVELVVARSGPEDTPLTPPSPSPIDRSPSAVSDTSKAGSDMVVSYFVCEL